MKLTYDHGGLWYRDENNHPVCVASVNFAEVIGKETNHAIGKELARRYNSYEPTWMDKLKGYFGWMGL